MKTQGSFPQYRKFLFETQPHSRIIFWEHLVDSSTTYHFEIETDFKTTEIVKPAKPIKTVSERIASRYLCNSLHVIDEANEQEDKAEDIPAQSDILPGS